MTKTDAHRRQRSYCYQSFLYASCLLSPVYALLTYGIITNNQLHQDNAVDRLDTGLLTLAGMPISILLYAFYGNTIEQSILRHTDCCNKKKSTAINYPEATYDIEEQEYQVKIYREI